MLLADIWFYTGYSYEQCNGVSDKIVLFQFLPVMITVSGIRAGDKSFLLFCFLLFFHFDKSNTCRLAVIACSVFWYSLVYRHLRSLPKVEAKKNQQHLLDKRYFLLSGLLFFAQVTSTRIQWHSLLSQLFP